MITEYKIICSGIKKKVIYHFSDTHLTEYDELSSKEEIDKAIHQTESWERVRADFARHGAEPYGEYEKRAPGYHFCRALETAKDGDALAIAGDLLDYVSPANIRFAEKHLSAFDKPYVAVCGNHENSLELPQTGALSQMARPVSVCDLGDLQLIGVDNSKRNVSAEQNDALRALLENGKKSVIVMHVPVMCESNAHKLKQSGVYFQFNYEGCPDENIDFINIIDTHSQNVVMVLAGHLHYSNYALISGKVPQFVSSQGIIGNINKYVIGEENEIF